MDEAEVRALRSFCYLFFLDKIFGLHICVLIDDLGLTFVLLFPFLGTFFGEHFVDDPRQVST